MDARLDNAFIDECMDKIQRFAVLPHEEEAAELAILIVIHDACRYLILNTTDDPELDLLAFKNHLTTRANVPHPSLPHYKTTLEYAASLVAINPVDATGRTS